MKNSIKPWKTCKDTIVFRSKWLEVHQEHVLLPNLVEIKDFYSVQISDAVMIAAIDPEGNILLKSEYRQALKQTLVELPAGMIDEKEEPLEAAKRELLEETGYRSNQWIELGKSYDSSSKLRNTMHLFLALECKKSQEPSFDRTELIQSQKVPLNKAVEMVMDNTICCNSSAHTILKVEKMLETCYCVKKEEKR